MIKNCITFEIEKDNRKYIFVMDSNAPMGEIHDVLHEMKSFIIQKISEVDKNIHVNETKPE